MKLTAERIAEIILHPETAHVECKSASGGLPNTMWETYSSFANTDGGVILLGVRERNHRFSVQGVSDADLLVKQIWDAVNNREVVSANILFERCVLWDRLKLRRPQIVEFYDPDRVNVKLSFSHGDGAELPQNCPKTAPRSACRYACSLV